MVAAGRALGTNSPALKDPDAPLLPLLTDVRDVAVEIAWQSRPSAERRRRAEDDPGGVARQGRSGPVDARLRRLSETSRKGGPGPTLGVWPATCGSDPGRADLGPGVAARRNTLAMRKIGSPGR